MNFCSYEYGGKERKEDKERKIGGDAYVFIDCTDSENDYFD